MEHDDEGNSESEAGLEKASNPQARKLRMHTPLDFVEVMPDELYG